MLSNRAHIKLDGIDYQLDEGQENHYVRRWESPLIQKFEIAGTPNKEHLDENRIIWNWTDAVGGEGVNIYDKEDPLPYYLSNGMNARVRGQWTVRPKRSVLTLPTNDLAKGTVMAVGAGAIWAGSDDRLSYSTDAGDTWLSLTAAKTGLNDIHASAYLTCITGDAEYVYYSGYRSGQRAVIRHAAVDDQEEVVVAESANNQPYAAMCIMGGRLYAWTGRRLYEHDIQNSMPITVAAGQIRKVYDTGTDPATSSVFNVNWTAECVAGDNAVYFHYSTAGMATVYEFRKGAGRPYWTAPIGFNINALAWQMGVLFVFGHWGGFTTGDRGRGGAYAIPADSRRPINLGYVRGFGTDHPHFQHAVPSFGSQVMVADKNRGRIFIYDMEFDAWSMLDDMATDPDAGAEGDELVFDDSTNKLGQILTFGPHRIATVYDSDGGAGDIQLVKWEDDRPVNREDSSTITDSSYLNTIESSKWDFDYPLSYKKLLGFFVVFEKEDGATTSGLLANQRILMKYALDDPAVSPTYTTAATITSASTPSGVKGRVWVPVSSISTTSKFYDLRMAVSVDNNDVDGVKPPIVKGVFAVAELAEHLKEWDLIIRLKDELNRTRPQDRKVDGDKLRDYIVASIESHEAVEFVDGYTSKRLNETDTYTVTILNPRDVINEKGESSLHITLREVPS